jgi:hypothetical protein
MTKIVPAVSLFYRLTRNMAASQAIRKLFPRPEFIPPESEVALEKVVFLDGYKSDHYELVSEHKNIDTMFLS